MNKLLHNPILWCIGALLGFGVSLYFLLSYLLKWYNADPRYLDLMVSSIAAFIITPLFVMAVVVVLSAVVTDLPTYAGLFLSEVHLPKANLQRANRPAKS